MRSEGLQVVTGDLAVWETNRSALLLRWRLISAATILTVVFALLHLDYHYPMKGFDGVPVGGIWLLPLAVLFAVLGAAETLGLLAAKGHHPRRGAVYLGTIAVLAGVCMPMVWPLFLGKSYPTDCPLGRMGWPLVGVAFTVMLAFVQEMISYQRPGGIVLRVALAIFTVCYVAIPLSFVVALRMFENHQVGIVALLSLIAIVKCGDTGAYTFGRLFGRHKMSPKLSPGKTWEGAMGGIASSVGVALLFCYLVSPALVAQSSGVWWGWVLYGVLVAIAGMIGDLAESMIKRDMECKDSSTWLRGLGGALDILDSIFFGAPIAYACWLSGLVIA